MNDAELRVVHGVFTEVVRKARVAGRLAGVDLIRWALFHAERELRRRNNIAAQGFPGAEMQRAVTRFQRGVGRHPDPFVGPPGVNQR